MAEQENICAWKEKMHMVNLVASRLQKRHFDKIQQFTIDMLQRMQKPLNEMDPPQDRTQAWAYEIETALEVMDDSLPDYDVLMCLLSIVDSPLDRCDP